MEDSAAAEESGLVDCPRSKLLLQGLQSRELVTIRCEPDGAWTVPCEILSLESGYLSKVFESKSHYMFGHQNARTLIEMFLQWVFTGTYQEHDRAVPYLKAGCNLKDSRNLSEVHHPQNEVYHPQNETMPWVVKASIQAWLFGASIQAPRFQNYAIKRLFWALSANDRAPKLHPFVFSKVFEYIYDTAKHSPMMTIFEYVFFQKWDDQNTMDLTHCLWSDLLKKHDRLRGQFLRIVAAPVEERRKITLELKDLLIKED